MLPPLLLRPERVLAGWSESSASYGALGVLHAGCGELPGFCKAAVGQQLRTGCSRGLPLCGWGCEARLSAVRRSEAGRKGGIGVKSSLEFNNARSAALPQLVAGRAGSAMRTVGSCGSSQVSACRALDARRADGWGRLIPGAKHLRRAPPNMSSKATVGAQSGRKNRM